MESGQRNIIFCFICYHHRPGRQEKHFSSVWQQSIIHNTKTKVLESIFNIGNWFQGILVWSVASMLWKGVLRWHKTQAGGKGDQKICFNICSKISKILCDSRFYNDRREVRQLEFTTRWSKIRAWWPSFSNPFPDQGGFSPRIFVQGRLTFPEYLSSQELPR